MPAWLAPALSAAGAALNLIGQNKRKSGTDFRKLRDDAIAGGFNPATALQATGGQAYDRGMSLSSMEMLGSVMQSAGGFFEAIDPVNAETRELENELLRKQIAQIDSEVATEGRPFGAVPSVRTYPQGSSVTGPKFSETQVDPVRGPKTGTGYRFGVHVDDPIEYEFETSAWRAAVDGEIVEWADDITGRNVEPDTHEFLRAYVTGINPMTYIRLGRRAKDAYLYQPPPLSDGGQRYEMWKSQMNYPSSNRRAN